MNSWVCLTWKGEIQDILYKLVLKWRSTGTTRLTLWYQSRTHGRKIRPSPEEHRCTYLTQNLSDLVQQDVHLKTLWRRWLCVTNGGCFVLCSIMSSKYSLREEKAKPSQQERHWVPPNSNWYSLQAQETRKEKNMSQLPSPAPLPPSVPILQTQGS